MYRKTHSYDPEKTTVLVNGVFITGFGDKGKINVSRSEESVLTKVGVDGGVHYATNNNITGKAKLTLMTTSPSLNYLRGLERSKEEFDLSIADLNDVGENVASEGCRITKMPDINISREVEEIEVEIFIPFLD